ncbi:toxin-antitoxin system YwqK family antitoxin [Corallococcus silvisoli]|uniref:toxin-antitoxin system YwqK family antitoxin n=1 Tax=Corallococcus silvisoli TaxID=2697031 RepID=UPI001378C329|nr:hypothetical protein [Corallococcus silvisoli]NBD09942.1 hypothetical protein [Corallococcus silvisoli]
MQRVQFDDLMVGDDQLMFWGDRPFSGVAFELFPNGRLAIETGYAEGLMEGGSRTWSELGVVVEEVQHWGGVRHGPSRSWDEEGRLRVEAVYEYGILVAEQRWSESGEKEGGWRMGPDDKLFRMLELNRDRFGGRAPPV